MAEQTQNIVEIPAPVETAIPTPTKGKAKAKATATKGKGKDLAPKEFAAELGIESKKLRRHLRDEYGVQHKAWVITPAMQAHMRAKLGKKAK